MNRTIPMLAVVALGLFCGGRALGTDPARKPNIIFVLADDKYL